MSHVETGDLENLFAKRTHHRRLLVDDADAAVGSRLGARPPACLASSVPKCPRCGGALQYQFTLAPDVLGAEISGGRSVSMLVCRAFKCRAESHGLVTPSAIVFAIHDESPRSDAASELDSVTAGRKLVLGPVVEDLHPETKVVVSSSKLGGAPGFISNWGEQDAAKVEANGGGLLMQWSEEMYPRGMKVGPAPFQLGVVYVFSKVVAGVPTLEDLGAIWQNT